MFEKPLLKDPKKEVIFGLVFVYEKVVTKKVHDLLRDSTPFQMAILVILCLYFLFSFKSPLVVVVDNYCFR